jgi:hypothetical protein
LAVLFLLAGLLGLFLLLAWVPIDLEFRFDSLGSPRFRWRIGWFFSLVGLDFPTGKRPGGKAKRHVKKKKRGRSIGKASFLRLLSKPLLFRFLGLIGKLRHAIHFRRLRADIRAGLGEPADTGMLFGAFSALIPFIAAPDAVRVRWEPDYGDEPVLEGTSEGLVRLRPIEVVAAVVRFFFSRPVLQTVKRGWQLWSNAQ